MPGGCYETTTTKKGRNGLSGKGDQAKENNSGVYATALGFGSGVATAMGCPGDNGGQRI